MEGLITYGISAEKEMNSLSLRVVCTVWAYAVVLDFFLDIVYAILHFVIIFLRRSYEFDTSFEENGIFFTKRYVMCQI